MDSNSDLDLINKFVIDRKEVTYSKTSP